MSVDTLSYVKRLEAAGVPRPQAEAHAEALRDEVAPQLATSVDLGAAVDRLEGKIEAAELRLDAKIEASAARLEAKIESTEARLDGRIDRLETKIETMMLRHTVAIILGVLAAGSFIVRFLR